MQKCLHQRIPDANLFSFTHSMVLYCGFRNRKLSVDCMCPRKTWVFSNFTIRIRRIGINCIPLLLHPNSSTNLTFRFLFGTQYLCYISFSVSPTLLYLSFIFCPRCAFNFSSLALNAYNDKYTPTHTLHEIQIEWGCHLQIIIKMYSRFETQITRRDLPSRVSRP